MSDLTLVHENPNAIWLPGSGVVDIQIRNAQRAVKDYDERLELARHEITRDWVVFVTLENGHLYPVIGLGKDLPHPDAIRERLWKADTKRHGEKLLHQINRRNEELRRKRRAPSREAAGIAAEAFEWGYRKMGVHPSPRIFVPRGI
jgi:hypothetical protein